MYHFNRDPLRPHGIPFYFVLKAGETFSSTKTRLQNRIGMSDKDFQKVKIVLVSKNLDISSIESGKNISLILDDILCDRFDQSVESLGLDHIDKSSRSGVGEKAIKIFN